MATAYPVSSNASPQPERDETPIPLCVDLDGTLVKSDLLFEQLVRLIRKSPLSVFTLLFIVLRRGIANGKRWLAEHVQVDISTLPYHAPLLAYLEHEAQKRPIWLCTGSDQVIARQIADHIGLFTGVLASDGTTNRTGKRKSDLLCQRFGDGGFDYVGNEAQDFEVWPQARHALVVSRSAPFLERVRARFDVVKTFPLPPLRLADLVKSIRAHQWTKNALILLPILLAHGAPNPTLISQCLLAFFSFSLMASATYILNDLVDLESDRQNHNKRHRPYASGQIAIALGLILIPLLGLSSIALASQLPLSFALLLLAYTVTTLLYTFKFKGVPMLDVTLLSLLYTLRVVVGMVLVGEAWSFWLLAFSLFFFFSLALAKRVTEITNKLKRQPEVQSIRGYHPRDLSLLINLGGCSGLLSVLVIAMYVNGEKVQELYQYPQLLWLICPIMLFWVARFWLITIRGGLHEDPILFAVRDKMSLVMMCICISIVLSAAYGGSLYAVLF
ncbi:UbiA family prenyltransferase [Ferrimonas marina]|uniref:4-hydroxybenzoate polyprenyltransferase n=1 Tax=Ferrimonas marina TaxID=299255 RepID=A0A1M5QV75_9GAMM|nr:UbiA family prenyltransferase [Ferrimonas marina]SHH18025.1 4-hydroxybenzoate polyprenyltransferase [Ferrimonas marina]